MILLKFIFFVLFPLISVAFVTLLERKVLSIVGFRLGPTKVSFFGLLQPLADAFKLANKSVNSLSNFSFFFYFFSSIMMIFMSLSIFFFFNIFPSFFNFKNTLLFFFLILSFNSLNSILVGWSTFSKFSLVGSIRTVCQLISYEAVLYLCLFFLLILFCSFNFSFFNFYPVYYLGLLIIPCFYIWVPSFLAELNRTPYDFSEGESELVSGFNTEFGSSSFTLIFLAEYGNIVFFCLMGMFLFFFPNFLFFLFFLFFVIFFRSVLPRFRFDKLMFICWKFFIPFLTFFFLMLFFFIY